LTRHPSDEVLALTRRYLEMVEGRPLSLDEKQAFIAETVEVYERHVNRGFIGYRKSVTEAGQFAALEWSGRGSVLRDLLDREYIDCLGGYGIFSAGVNHPRILRAVACQMQRMALNSQELLEPWRAALARLLAMVTPGELGNAFFINNGTDAIEGAIKLARLYTGRNLFISTLGGFHGKSMGSLSLMGKASFREPFAGGLQDVRFVPYGDADALEAELAKGAQVGTPVAGFVVEPIQGEAGGVVPPEVYLPRARELCSAHGALLIADEIQTGMGRTGTLWGVDHTGHRARHHVRREIHRRRHHAALGVHLHARDLGGADPQPDHPLDHLRRQPDGLRGGHRGDSGNAGRGPARTGGHQGRIPAPRARHAAGEISRSAH
jgi:hypothetical protein